jgi:hypothetical protein
MYYYLFHYGMPVVTFFEKTYNYLYNELLDTLKMNVIYFYENNPTGYLEAFVKNTNHNGTVVWKYNRSKKLFFQYNCINRDTKHFPILSATLQHENATISLDDFINDIHIEASNLGFPTLQQVLEVWIFSSGIVLDRTKPWKFNYMDSELNEFSIDPFKDSWNFTKNHKN